jgi:UDP-N-acetylmuramate: L-alanyl-gamma-D-glutamyl-meso-diaminopimelate ligase
MDDERHAMSDLRAVRRVHFIAIGGVGMSALAGLMKQSGFVVRGSDEALYPPISHVLERLKIPLLRGFCADHLNDRPDLVVVGNKVSRGNPEVEALLNSGLPFLSFPEALARFFLSGRRSLVVAGTHGKTTSTAMLAWVLERTGRDPSMMVGGQSLNFGGNFKLGRGEFFVVEGDEYDTAFFDKKAKFLHYRPSAVLLTSVEFDHADIYADLAAVKAAFRELVEIVPAGAPLVVANDFPHAVDVVRGARAKVTSFGLTAGADWQVRGLRDTDGLTCFEVERGDLVEGTLCMPQPGPINACNALGVYVLARELGLSHREVETGLREFKGVARRQEVAGEVAGVLVIDDFAHHPTAVSGTLQAVRRRYPGRRLWALFEPRSNTTRRRIFQADYVAALENAERIVVAPVFQKQSDVVAPEDCLSVERLIADLRRRGKEAWAVDGSEAIAKHVVGRVESGDVIVLMSNGDFGGLRAKLMARLEERWPAPGD